LKAIYRALDALDVAALAEAQARQDALGAQKVIQEALFSSMGEPS
jgi:xylose isomerase